MAVMRCKTCWNLEKFCTCKYDYAKKMQPIAGGSEKFDEAVRAMARRKGYEVPDDAVVSVTMTGEWSGFSEYTITNQWDEFTIDVAGVHTFVYSTEEDTREVSMNREQLPKAAMARFWEDMLGV